MTSAAPAMPTRSSAATNGDWPSFESFQGRIATIRKTDRT
jgi:hypothetical protein